MSKDLFNYYLWAMLVPISILVWLFEHQTGSLPVTSLLVYCLIYRPILDSYRLIQKGVIQKKDTWKMFVVFGHIKWFKELYLDE